MLRSAAQAALFIVAGVLGASVVARFVLAQLAAMEAKLMTQLEDLRGAISSVSNAADGLASQVDDVATRVLAKLDELGQPDPDLSADIAALQATAQSINSQTSELESIVPAAEEPAPTPEPTPAPAPAPEPTDGEAAAPGEPGETSPTGPPS